MLRGVVERFELLPVLVLAFAAGLGASELERLARGRVARLAVIASLLVVVLVPVVPRMRAVLHEALTTKEPGPKVIVASSECMLNKQRREIPLKAAAICEGRRVEAPRFGVDEAICTGDHACMRLSGCPSLSLKKLDDPLRDDPVAAIDQSCVGCGNCGEVAHAAILCPSFYRAEIVQNPTWLDRSLMRIRRGVIGFLQARQRVMA